MKIDVLGMLEDYISNSNVKDFINELSKFLEEKDNREISAEIKRRNKTSLISENRMIKEENEIRKKYKNQPEKIKQEIIKMTNRILREQNERLSENRREGHLYMVEEDVNERIYLVDLSSNKGSVFEEVDFPKSLIGQATEGVIFKYENGEYCFYSNDGFDRIYNN